MLYGTYNNLVRTVTSKAIFEYSFYVSLNQQHFPIFTPR